MKWFSIEIVPMSGEDMIGHYSGAEIVLEIGPFLYRAYIALRRKAPEQETDFRVSGSTAQRSGPKLVS